MTPKNPMSHDVVQWLNEVKELNQQLDQARKSEESAHLSADNWRKLYETEAKQRQTEVKLMQQTIEHLQAEIEVLKKLPQGSETASMSQIEIDQAVYQLQTPDQLRTKLIEVWADRDRLAQDLKREQANHVQTRKELTMALGDTIDLFAKLKGGH
jgi:predicted RNase H-like nuclease (RuvC/YqgF family)